MHLFLGKPVSGMLLVMQYSPHSIKRKQHVSVVEACHNYWYFFYHVYVQYHNNYDTTYPTGQNATNGPIRLWRNGVTSLSYTSGRVQIYFNNGWGNICDDVDFGLAEATVICIQLGYTGASNHSRAQNDGYTL